MDFFTDEHRHPYFHTNNLWFDLQALHDALVQRRGILGLPLIRNTKTVDPTDPASPQVIQIETAMGAAIEVFDGARAIVVPRERFLPVKTTNDLLLLRSDAYDLGADGVLRLSVPSAPLVDLDSRHYRTIADFEARFPAGAPSLRGARRLAVRGDWTFGAGVVVTGDARLDDPGTARTLAPGTHLGS
jgi:UTP--glucose-1-phosphate uridylyltransferase